MDARTSIGRLHKLDKHAASAILFYGHYVCRAGNQGQNQAEHSLETCDCALCCFSNAISNGLRLISKEKTPKFEPIGNVLSRPSDVLVATVLGFIKVGIVTLCFSVTLSFPLMVLHPSVSESVSSKESPMNVDITKELIALIVSRRAPFVNGVLTPRLPVTQGVTNTGLIFPATNGVLSGVLMANTVINGVPSSYIYLPPPAPSYISSGTAVFNFTLATAGNYEIQALVDAPSTEANSFSVNIDAPPVDPTMIWDIMPITSGFEQRIVGWRGGGTQNNDQIVPKVFSLSAGPHQLFFKGETPGTALASFTLLHVIPAAPASPASELMSIQSNSTQLRTIPDGPRSLKVLKNRIKGYVSGDVGVLF